MIQVWIISFVIFFLYIYIRSLQFSNRNLPPGPFVWPLGLGVVPSVLFRVKKLPTFYNLKNVRPWEIFHLWYKQFGEIYSIQAGNFYTVIVASHEIMTELAHTEEYSAKLSHELFTQPRTFGKELGLIFCANPAIWVEMRKFTQRTLREFGFGKRHTMQSAVEAEIHEFIKQIKENITTGLSGDYKKNGGIMRIRTCFLMPILNVLWCMVAGCRYAHTDPKLVTLMELNFAMTKSTTFMEPLQALAPWLKKWAPWLVNEDIRRKSFDQCHEFTRKLVEERRVSGDGSEPQSFIDVFLRKIEENKGDPTTIYTLEQLQAMLADLLQTGSTTTVGTLNYALLYLTLHPDVQRKCREEIDRVVARHLIPTPEDVEKMPYFQAFILETHRLANVVPNPIPRIAPKDWDYRGYKIPKGSFIVSNHYSVHMDKEYWVDPEEFRPERFINSKGEFVPDKRVVHFGYGKRICIGITLANHVIPVFMASLVQNFEFSVVPGENAPSSEPEIGVSLSPREFSVYVTCRQ